jgi:hypothetical protein
VPAEIFSRHDKKMIAMEMVGQTKQRVAAFSDAGEQAAALALTNPLASTGGHDSIFGGRPR